MAHINITPNILIKFSTCSPILIHSLARCTSRRKKRCFASSLHHTMRMHAHTICDFLCYVQTNGDTYAYTIHSCTLKLRQTTSLMQCVLQQLYTVTHTHACMHGRTHALTHNSIVCFGHQCLNFCDYAKQNSNNNNNNNSTGNSQRKRQQALYCQHCRHQFVFFVVTVVVVLLLCFNIKHKQIIKHKCCCY